MTPQEAIKLYDDALTDFAAALEDAAHAVQLRDIAKQSLATIEAEVTVNGGCGGMALDGKNAEIRAAQLKRILAGHPDYSDDLRELQKAARKLANAEAQRDTAAEQMRFCRAVLAYETARLQREAYAHGGDGIRD